MTNCRRLHAWLTLLRPPNLFTVPGDVVAGFFLAGGAAGLGRLPLLVGASLALYAAGLLLNDWFDLERDRRERPERPLPSGAVSDDAALATAFALVAAGLILAAIAGAGSLATAAALAGLIALYNGAARKFPPAGFLAMGLCRGANVMLGASVAFPALPVPAIAAALVATIYIALVTAAAHKETERPPGPFLRWSLPAVVGAGLLFMLLLSGILWIGVVVSIVAVGSVLQVAAGLRPDLPAREIPRKVGALLRCLIPLQTAFVLVAAPAALLPAAILYALWPVAWLAGRKFYGS